MVELGSAELLLRVLLAAVLGGAIGLERELRDREAGLRTHLLVCVGATLFMMVSAYAWTDWHFSNRDGIVFDPTRIAAQIVTGIGFLGAGAIIRQGFSVKGLTTAATLWVVAAIGMATGVGYYEAAIATTVLVVVCLWPLRIVAFKLSRRFRPDEGVLAVELRRGASAVGVLQAMESAGVQVSSMAFEDEGDIRRLDIQARLAPGRDAATMIDALGQSEGVRGARWNP